jgi:hypothetical protein
LSDGHTEWFRQMALPLALRALAQMPATNRVDRLARLVPVQSGPPPMDAVSIENGPLDAW